MNYPNRVIKKGDGGKNIVMAVQQKLNEKSCGPLVADGDFGDKTASAVKLFQSRHTDQAGNPLKTDGQIGAITWAALFGTDTVANTVTAASPLLAKAVQIAISQIGKIEQPLGSNRGPEVDLYLRAAGLDPATGSYPWCAAFVYWCFSEAAKNQNINTPLIRTAGVLDHWKRAKCPKVTKAEAVNDPGLVKPGNIFIADYGSGLGHTGIVESVNGGNLTTIEGNTNNGQSRDGYGVFRLTKRKIADISKGFLDYAG